MNLILIPGFMADAGLWDDMADALAVLGPVRHADLGQDDSIAAMARRLVANAPDRFSLVGFSMGGYVAREVVRLVPDRVQALVLIATSSRADTPDQTRRKAEAAHRLAQTAYAGLSRSAILSSIHRDRAGDETLIEHIRAMGLRLGQGAFLRQSTLARDGDTDRLGDIACPTLVIAAAQDRLRSLAEAEELRDGIPGAVLRVIENTGHMIPMEQPVALAATMLPWLREQEP